jgi:hypothetical protein
MPDNLLYYGDRLDILWRYLKDETVDLGSGELFIERNDERT